MTVITDADIQQWLEPTKFHIDSFDPELEGSARELAFSTLSPVYSIDTWTDESTTPKLVKDAIGMIVASWLYDRAFSEDFPDGTGWAQRLYDRAMTLLNGIVSGLIDIGESSTIVAGVSEPLYYPMDDTLSEDGVTTERAHFRMGMTL
jgi:hypothetical protein